MGKSEESQKLEFSSQNQKKDKRMEKCKVIVAIFVFFGYVVSLLLFCLFFIGKLYTSSPNGDFKWICASRFPVDQFCFISVGQYAVGLISIGQFAVGLISIAQIGSGLLCGVGQIQASLGVVLAQFALGTFILIAQLGFASFRVMFAHFGYQLQLCQKKKDLLFVSCCRRK